QGEPTERYHPSLVAVLLDRSVRQRCGTTRLLHRADDAPSTFREQFVFPRPPYPARGFHLAEERVLVGAFDERRHRSLCQNLNQRIREVEHEFRALHAETLLHPLAQSGSPANEGKQSCQVATEG